MDDKKKAIRNFIREKGRSYSAEEREQMSREIIDKLLADGDLAESKEILVFHPLKDEPDLVPLYPKLRERGQKLWLPRIIGVDIEICCYESEDDLHEGAFHIMEPAGEPLDEKEWSRIDTVVVPGMAFDRHNTRVGRGKGYYDRLLSKMPPVKKIGVCFPYQRMPSLPCEDHDVKVDKVVS